jgi:hypothetical protein
MPGPASRPHLEKHVTSPRDQIDDWLGGEVTPLSPPRGSLDQIRRRARQRKTRQAVFAAAGCAVVLAAAVAVPQLVLAGKPGGSNPPLATARTPSSIQPSTSHGAANSPAPDTSGQLQMRTRLSTTTSGALPPPNFQPTSVTMVGAGNGLVGAVIGQAGTPGHCATPACTSLAGTSDYGASWYGVSAPVAPGPDGDTGVSQLRFANLSDGWAFGPALFETSRGGWPWAREDTYGKRVIDVEAAGGHAYAIFGTCTGTGADYAANCTSFSLYTSVAGSRSWTAVTLPAGFAQMTSTASAAPLLVISGGVTVYVLTPSGQVLSGPVSGGAWRALGAAPCKPGPVDVAAQDAQNPGAQLAAGPQLLLTCGAGSGTAQAQSTLYTSPDGASWTSAGIVQDAGSAATGTATSLASAAPGQVLLATTTGIQNSVNDGQTWHLADVSGGVPAGGFGYVGMTNATQGVAVPANAALGEIFVTSDGGKTWSASRIRQ